MKISVQLRGVGRRIAAVAAARLAADIRARVIEKPAPAAEAGRTAAAGNNNRPR